MKVGLRIQRPLRMYVKIVNTWILFFFKKNLDEKSDDRNPFLKGPSQV